MKSKLARNRLDIALVVYVSIKLPHSDSCKSTVLPSKATIEFWKFTKPLTLLIGLQFGNVCWEFEYQGCICWYSDVLPSHLRSCYRSGPAFAILRCLVFIEGIRVANYKPPVAFENLHYVSKNNMGYSFNRSLDKDNSQLSLRVPDLAYSS